MVGCADVSQSVGTCGPKHYSSAENLTVRSCLHEHEDGAKDLRITWEPPTGAVELPGTYFVTLYTQLYTQNRPWRYFKVTDSLQVTVRNVSASFNYSVKVQPYGRCVGVGDYPAENKLGCGDPTGRIKEILTECENSSPSTALDDIITSPAGHTLVVFTNHTFSRPGLFLIIIFITVAVVSIIAIIVSATLCIAICRSGRNRRTSLSGQNKYEVKKPYQFVSKSPGIELKTKM